MFTRTLLAGAIALSASMAVLAENPASAPADKAPQIGKISEWIGKSVMDQQGNSVGNLKDFAVNLDDATIPFAVVELDGMFSSKSIAVPLSALEAVPGDKSAVSLAATESQWKAAKTFDKESWPLTATLMTGPTAAAAVAARTTAPAPSAREPVMTDQDREFTNMDRDSDGYLSTSEIEARSGLSMIRDSDTNHDGRIDRAEFSAFEAMEQKSRNDADGSDKR
ncbi:MAG: PRC-barrel domain-containing protein [Pseudomonadales bacterium]